MHPKKILTLFQMNDKIFLGWLLGFQKEIPIFARNASIVKSGFVGMNAVLVVRHVTFHALIML